MKITGTLLFVLLALGETFCQVRLPRLISNGMVLQRDAAVKVWGWASSSEKVEVTFKGKTYKTSADDAGHWNIKLPPQPAGGPYEMTVRGKNEIRVSDILFGDVWVCSGQSNMELTMERVKEKYPEVIAASTNGQIRQFVVPDQYDFKVQHKDLDGGSWTSATPANVLGFSAVAYFFALEIYDKHHVPIGLINAALGGSPVESWMSEDVIKNFPEAFGEFQRFQHNETIRKIETDDRQRNRYWHAAMDSLDPGIKSANRWYDADLDEREWKEITVPGFWADAGYKNGNGSAWYRRKVSLPASMTGKPAKLWLGRIVDQDSVFINGRFVGTTSYQYPPRRYNVNAGLLKEGENTIAVRVINQSGRGGFITDKPYYLAVDEDTVDLKGAWKFRPGAVMAPLEGPTFIRWKPVGLFNKMISPLLSVSIKGVLWYQGEANTGKPAEYEALFPALIRDWRARWGQGDFPFLYVQLANYMKSYAEPRDSKWAALRNAQLKTLSVPNTGMAVAIDLGEWNDIHPLNKADVGRRLALLARKIAYGERDLVASGPLPVDARFEGQQVTITFEHTGTGLTIKNSDRLNHFAVSEDGKKFVWAEATVKKNKVIVTASNVSTIKAVRYAWADNPEGVNLYNSEGLPATPFEMWKPESLNTK